MNMNNRIKTLSDKEKELLQKVLTKTDWDLTNASRLLQIPLTALRQKIKEHGFEQDPEDDAVNSKPDDINKRRKK